MTPAPDQSRPQRTEAERTVQVRDVLLAGATTTDSDLEHELAAITTDPLDGSVWIELATAGALQPARTLLQDYGYGVLEHPPARLQVTGWDARALHRRLRILLAGVDDLTLEWDATAELARYHYDQRAAASANGAPDPVEVLADVEHAMRQARPLPHRGPNTDDIDTLLQLIAAAEDAYTQLIDKHLHLAEAVIRTLAGDTPIDQTHPADPDGGEVGEESESGGVGEGR